MLLCFSCVYSVCAAAMHVCTVFVQMPCVHSTLYMVWVLGAGSLSYICALVLRHSPCGKKWPPGGSGGAGGAGGRTTPGCSLVGFPGGSVEDAGVAPAMVAIQTMAA